MVRNPGSQKPVEDYKAAGIEATQVYIECPSSVSAHAFEEVIVGLAGPRCFKQIKLIRNEKVVPDGRAFLWVHATSKEATALIAYQLWHVGIVAYFKPLHHSKGAKPMIANPLESLSWGDHRLLKSTVAPQVWEPGFFGNPTTPPTFPSLPPTLTPSETQAIEFCGKYDMYTPKECADWLLALHQSPAMTTPVAQPTSPPSSSSLNPSTPAAAWPSLAHAASPAVSPNSTDQASIIFNPEWVPEDWAEHLLNTVNRFRALHDLPPDGNTRTMASIDATGGV